MPGFHRTITRVAAACGIVIGAYALVVAAAPQAAHRDPAPTRPASGDQTTPAAHAPRSGRDTATLIQWGVYTALGLTTFAALVLCSVSRNVRRELARLAGDIGRLSSHTGIIDPQGYRRREVRACAGELERIAQWMRAERGRLTDDASRDPLTGLPNRRSMMDCLSREVASAGRTGWPLSLIMADLDHFKNLNDTYGHQAGDFVLKRASERMASLVRQTDLVARYGGEEFAIILPRADLAQGMDIAWQLCNALRCDLMLIDEQSIKVSASFGVAELPEGEPHEVDALVRAADRALYRAKEQGRNTVVAAPKVVVADSSQRGAGDGQPAASTTGSTADGAKKACPNVDADTMALMGSTFSVLQVMPDRHRVAHDMLQQVAATLECANVSLYLLDEETNELRAAAWVGAPAYRVEGEGSIIPPDLSDWFSARRASERTARERNVELVEVGVGDEAGLRLRVLLEDENAWIGVIEADGVPPGMAETARARRLLSAVCLIGTAALRVCELFSGQERRWTALTETLCNMMQTGTAYKHDHAAQVSDLALRIARTLGQTNEEELRWLRLAGLVHDVGEIAVPLRIRAKRGRLRATEWRQMQEHARVSAEIIGNAFHMSSLEDIVLHHHERFDGTGYPHHLVGERIPLESRILAVADAFVAMTSQRPHRRTLSKSEAVENVIKGSGAQFDPLVVNAFLRCELDDDAESAAVYAVEEDMEPAASTV